MTKRRVTTTDQLRPHISTTISTAHLMAKGGIPSTAEAASQLGANLDLVRGRMGGKGLGIRVYSPELHTLRAHMYELT